jgi:hypothetical protein
VISHRPLIIVTRTYTPECTCTERVQANNNWSAPQLPAASLTRSIVVVVVVIAQLETRPAATLEEEEESAWRPTRAVVWAATCLWES